MQKRLQAALISAASALLLVPAGSAEALNADTLVNVGSPSSPFSANKQNEPAIAVDAHNPQVMADENHSHRVFFLEPPQQLEYFSLHGDV